MLSLTVPCYNGGQNLRRTIDSARPHVDEVILVATPLFDEDLAAIKSAADKVVVLPWNYVFHNGFGPLYNTGSSVASGWQCLLGVGETVFKTYGDMRKTVERSSENTVYYCDHINDPNKWGRIWNHRGGTKWEGIIHETITGGSNGGLLFEMRDTEKIPDPDPLRSKAFYYIKLASYNYLYKQLLLHPDKLGGANRWWLSFVQGAKDTILAFNDSHSDMIDAALSGDSAAFIKSVETRMTDECTTRS